MNTRNRLLALGAVLAGTLALLPLFRRDRPPDREGGRRSHGPPGKGLTPPPGETAGRESPETAAIPEEAAPLADPVTDVGRIYALLQERHAAAWGKTHGSAPGMTRFARERLFGYREGRLLALAFPDESENLGRVAATDPTRPLHERVFAVHLLSAGAARGRKGAEAALYELAAGREAGIAGHALLGLFRADGEGNHRSLYWQLCQGEDAELIVTSVQVLSHWADGTTEKVMAGLSGLPPTDMYPQSEIPSAAKDALEKVRLLSSPDWQERLENILREYKGRDVRLTPWALVAARARGMTTLPRVLRQRLDGALSEEKRSPFFSETLPSSANVNSDGYFDDVLVTLAELGGELTDLERRRLRLAGYACDPRERLLELLAADRPR